MKAFVYKRYGSPDVLQIKEVAKPVPTNEQILIKIHAVSINGSDKENLIGKPGYVRMGGLFKPGNPILGSDIAGVVEAVGKNNTEFQVGDEVFGEIPGYHGGFAEYICTSGKTMMPKPKSMTFEEAAAIPQGGVIAFNGIIKRGGVQSGQKVLINGAGGSGGTFAVQLAKLQGAEVTGVDNAGKMDFLRSLGVDHVMDYTREDFTKSGGRFDLILDLIAHRSAFAYPRALKPNGTYFFTGGSLATLLQILILGPLIKRMTGKNVRMLVVPQNREDLNAITELIVTGKVHPAIDKTFTFDDIPEAMRYVSEGHAKGKVVITMKQDSYS
ncbi:MAG TPA: NAD(P)-dependent alcohol dehydrogenase [Anaerolineales bacterium]